MTLRKNIATDAANRGPVPYTSLASPVDFSPAIAWVQITSAGSGGLVVKDEAGTSQTYSGLVNGQTLYGPFSEFTSMTCSAILAGDGRAPTYSPNAVASAVTNVASVAAMKALATAANGQQFQSAADGSNWRYVSTSVLADDGGFLVAGATGIGSGAFLRTDRVVDFKLAVAFGTADATVLYTAPAGFRCGIQTPWWEVTTSFTGGTSSAIGISSGVNAGFSTKGDLLGGASGDVAATLVSTGQLAKGTVGAKIPTPGAVLVGADTIRFDRITSAFTAGAGFVHVPVLVELAPAA